MEKIRDAIYEEIDSLYNVAVGVQTTWMKKVAEREVNRDYSDKNNMERTSYELRVEFKGCSFTLRWLHIQFVKRSGKTIRVVKSIAIPENGKYKLSSFKYANEWEQEYISQIEDVLAPIRVQLKHLMKAHQSILYADKAGRKELTSIEIKDRVEVNSNSIQQFKKNIMHRG